MMLSSSSFLLLLVPTTLASFQFDNALREKPLIECGHNQISLKVETEKDAPAHVFAKGHYRKDGCSFNNATHVVFDFDSCDVSRKREVNPRGMSYSMTVVVQLHPLFVTKVDRAYHVHCFYQESDKAVGTGMNVTDPTPIDLSTETPLPECLYTLHKDSPNGPVVKFAQVGDSIYHAWECQSDVYSMMVHDCDIVDGQGNQHRVIDSNGCSTDDYLLPELSYANDLTKSFTAASAFNFPDQNTVYFNCQIKLCVKGTEECAKITPPRCGAGEQSQQNQDTLNSDLDNDQLITTTPEPSTSPSPSPSTSTSASTTTAAPEATTTTVVTTVTELSSTTTAAPETTTVVLPARFPVPGPLAKDSAELNQNDVTEGSGLEIVDQPASSTPVSLIVADDVSGGEVYLRPADAEAVARAASSSSSDERTTTAKREIRRRDTVVDVDITSPELTIVDKEYGSELPEALRSSQPLPPSSPRSPSVCLSLAVFWLLSALCIICASIIAAALCYAQKQKSKFRMMP